jgi:hypothetical protein
MRAILLGTLLWLVFQFSRTEWRGITVTLENRGPSTLDSVVVHVTGNRYAVGSLAPGQRESVRVQPTGESHVEIEHSRARRRLVLDTYLEPGYRQHVRARIVSDSVLSLRITHPFQPAPLLRLQAPPPGR